MMKLSAEYETATTNWRTKKMSTQAGNLVNHCARYETPLWQQISAADAEEEAGVHPGSEHGRAGKSHNQGRQAEVKMNNSQNSDEDENAGEYLPKICQKSLLQAELGALYDIQRNIQSEADHENQHGRARFRTCGRSGSAK